jgi:hypothetical protein
MWEGHVAHTGERRGVYRVLVGRPEGKRPLGRPRRRWEDNIKMGLKVLRTRFEFVSEKRVTRANFLFRSGTRGSFPGVKRPGREADHSPPPSAEVKECKNAWSYTSTPQCVFMAWCLIKHRGHVRPCLCMKTCNNQALT